MNALAQRCAQTREGAHTDVRGFSSHVPVIWSLAQSPGEKRGILDTLQKRAAELEVDRQAHGQRLQELGGVANMRRLSSITSSRSRELDAPCRRPSIRMRWR